MAGATEYTPTGTLNTAEDIFIEGGPTLYFGGESQYSPDSNGWYWGITGTAQNPVYQVGCYQNFQLSDNVTTNEVRCDTVGVKSDISRRNFLESTFDLQALLPLAQLRYLLRASDSEQVLGEDTEYMGIGEINQQEFFKVFFSQVYDETAGDWLAFTGHHCQFHWNGAWAFRYGEPWAVGIRVRMYADETLPAVQRFATVVRYDPSVL